MKFLHDVLVVELKPDTRIGRIFVPETTRQYQIQRATVLAIGADFQHPEIKIGDTVLVSDHFGTAYTYEGRKCRIYDGEDVLAKMTK